MDILIGMDWWYSSAREVRDNTLVALADHTTRTERDVAVEAFNKTLYMGGIR